MRADKDFKTYEQALTIVQRYGELAEADYSKGKHKEALYSLAHATFVGVKHLLFMAADAAIDRAEARELAANNHLAIVELLSLALSGSGHAGDDDDTDKHAVEGARAGRQRRAMQTGPKPIKGAKVTARAGVDAPRSARRKRTLAAAGTKRRSRTSTNNPR